LEVTRGQRLYFAAVGALALWVGVWGFFLPARVDTALPWLVPPLHARFLGAMYLSGATFMALSLAARWWDEVRIVVPMIAIWTGVLYLVSLLDLDAFDFGTSQTRAWFWAYFVYPAIAVWLTWRHRDAPAAATAKPRMLRSWARGALAALGVVATVLGVALLTIPVAMQGVWPWPIEPLLARIYAAPFLSYGLGSLAMARARTWSSARIPVLATLVFTGGVLVASTLHRALFSATQLPDQLWFLAFAAATLALATIGVRGARPAASAGEG